MQVENNKSTLIGAQEYVPFEHNKLTIVNIKDTCQKHFGPQIKKDLVLAGERGPSCNKMAHIPIKEVFYVRFVIPEAIELEDGDGSEHNREVPIA